MAKSLDDIRAKLRALDKKATFTAADKTTYQHWNIPTGTSATLRFLPDGNPDNVFFWVEKSIIKLPFVGVKGFDESKQVLVTVPCMHTWNETCPILTETAPWWKDERMVDAARIYWKKKTFMFQGFVKIDPIADKEEVENPIRKFVMTSQLFPIIKNSLLDPDMENSPVDYINGTDFIVTKGIKGDWADYSTSKWARKETPLNEEQLEAIEKFGLVNLSNYLPKKPTPEALNVIREMFFASYDGELYDPQRWGKFYKPHGLEVEGSGTADSDSEFDQDATKTSKRSFSAPSTQKAVQASPVVDVDMDDHDNEDDAAGSEEVTKKKTPQELLAMVRSRSGK